MDIHKLPTLDQLKVQLGISDPGQGKIHQGYGAIGFHVDDHEAQHAILNEHGEVQFNTGVEFPDMLYRGQVQEFLPCLPSLGRLRHLEDKLVAVCRNLAFEQAIRVHPYARHCAQVRWGENPLYIDYQGLAQHYGFHTDMLDVTSNFNVAMFFACCEWDSQKNSYQPVAHRRQPGVIYGVPPFLFALGPEAFRFGAKFQFVGWQPLPRPAQQRAGAFIMQPGRCFATLPGVKRAYFRHDLRVAEKVWEAFQGGEILFPYDEVAELSRTLQGLAETTTPVLDRAWSVLEKWEGKQIVKEHRSNVLKASGLRVVPALDLSWEKLNLPSNPQKLLERLSAELGNVRYRRAMYLK